jgi:hypothetical protein
LIEPSPRSKEYAELAEAALLHVAEGINRYPIYNGNNGKGSAALGKCLRYQRKTIGTIRIVVSGRDPLRDPSISPMKQNKWIVLRPSDEGWGIDECHWNNRAVAA